MDKYKDYAMEPHMDSIGDVQAWESSLETGMAQIDEQHKSMFRQINALTDRSRPDRVAGTLEFLKNYVAEHFKLEERLHEETDYPEAEEHFAKHNAFIKKFLELKSDYEKDAEQQNLLTLLKLTQFLLDWLRTHITTEDSRFAEYYLARFPDNAGPAKTI